MVSLMELVAEIDVSDMQWDSEGESEIRPSLMHKSAIAMNYFSCSSERKQFWLTTERILKNSTHPMKNMMDYVLDEQWQVIGEFGFGSILNVKEVEVDEEMFNWLVDNFDIDGRTLNVHG